MLVVVAITRQPFRRRVPGHVANIQLKDELARLPGVAEVSILGRQDVAMRIRLEPDKLAALNLTAADVTRALEQQNLKATAGQPAGPGAATISRWNRGTGGCRRSQLEAIAIKSDPEGHVTRLRDVATAWSSAPGRRASRASTAGRPRSSQSTRSRKRLLGT